MAVLLLRFIVKTVHNLNMMYRFLIEHTLAAHSKHAHNNTGKKENDNKFEATQLRNCFSWSDWWPVSTCPGSREEITGLLCDYVDKRQDWVHWVYRVGNENSKDFLLGFLLQESFLRWCEPRLDSHLSSILSIPSLWALILLLAWHYSLILNGDVAVSFQKLWSSAIIQII